VSGQLYDSATVLVGKRLLVSFGYKAVWNTEDVWMLWRREISVALLWNKPQFLRCSAHKLLTNGPGFESRGFEIFRTPPYRPWSPPSLLYKGSGSFPRVKRPGHGVDHPPPI